MSYDLDLGDKAEFNITYNVGYMFYPSYKDVIRVIDGKYGWDSVHLLQDIRNNIEENYIDYVAQQPENGWGTVENTLKCLNKMILKSLEYPNEIWEAE